MPQPITQREEKYSTKRFIREFMNNRNAKIRWLRGIFMDEEEKIETILEYMRGIEEESCSILQSYKESLLKEIEELKSDWHSDAWNEAMDGVRSLISNSTEK